MLENPSAATVGSSVEETPLPYESFLRILRRSPGKLTEAPKEDIYSVERLEQYAAHLAREFKLRESTGRGRALLPKVKQYGRDLQRAYLSLGEAFRAQRTVSPAAEWFLDNFHIVQEQLAGVKRDLPPKYYDELPKLASGELAGYPRIYAMALAILAHTDSHLDVDTLRRFIQSFQRVSPLKAGELWAVAITLRIALLEHLNNLAHRIVESRRKREDGNSLADIILERVVAPDSQSSDLVDLLASQLAKPENVDHAFIEQLAQRLRDQDPDVWPVFDYLEKFLRKHGTSTAQIVQYEIQGQAGAQATVGNVISSLRLLQSLDWRDFFESCSMVDPILATDPADAYWEMDFHTRDRYRHAVERIAKRARGRQARGSDTWAEIEVAQRAVQLARDAAAQGKTLDARKSHVGYYLIGDGVGVLEAEFRYRARFKERLDRLVRAFPTPFYLGSLFILTAAALSALGGLIAEAGVSVPWTIAFVALALFPASELALGIVNHLVLYFMRPQLLPKMDSERGIPDDSKTMVVIPTLLTTSRGIRKLLRNLEVYSLANDERNLSFALLGDFADADSEHAPNDAEMIALAEAGIAELNRAYAERKSREFELKTDANADSHAGGAVPALPRFYLFQRRRQWNASEGKWMGWERKRGKILEFNGLLRGAADTSYLPHRADAKALNEIVNVITLDSDTQLPRNCARRLVATINHPLNRPRFSRDLDRVVDGYGILQPRIGVDLTSSQETRFSRIFSGNTGLDPYTTAVSDVYQDLFAEGSFTGKGLYVVDAFEAALTDRAPENAVLSHDLFEGSFARTALVSDVELYDDYPSEYGVFSKRQHRWTRGDWQIFPWLLPFVKNARGVRTRNRLPLIARWKIFDNLRRSLVAPCAFVILIFAWIFVPTSAVVWTVFVTLVLTFPLYAPVLTLQFLSFGGQSFTEHVRSTVTDFANRFEQFLLTAAFLPGMAWNHVDAIVRTLYRMAISRKRLLEWVTFAAQIEAGGSDRVSFAADVGIGPPLAVGLALGLAFLRIEAFAPAAPYLLVWFSAPLLRRWLRERPRGLIHPELGNDEIRTFRSYARRTWHFFETFVTPEGNHLAPDNFQEDPQPLVAHRTSPTNIGLQFLALSSAHDLGYVGFIQLIESAEAIFATLAKLARYRGHFYNWYDTRTLEPLRPEYVSTVDSGNLAGHLIAFKQACAELKGAIGPNPAARAGLLDTLSLLIYEAERVEGDAKASGPATSSTSAFSWKHLLEVLALVRRDAEGLAIDDAYAPAVRVHLKEAEDLLAAIGSGTTRARYREVNAWLAAALGQLAEMTRDRAAAKSAEAYRTRLTFLMEASDEIVGAMEFRFLFDERRKIFSIGYNVADNRRDNSFYDLLASESRLASFVAIAKGDVPEEHWFRLGRQMTRTSGSRALIAWTATMFEYLMPALVMRRYRDTLLDQTARTIVRRQIAYGAENKVPWGISESGYNARDLNLNYQYGPFGIPGLGLRRGLSDDLVVSPYSTMLAAMIDPWAALANLERLRNEGALSHYGFYEAIDYTSIRLPENQRRVLIRSYMAHHQGMALVSLNNLVNGFSLERRFHADARVQATELLLQERIPRAVNIVKPRADEVHSQGAFRFSAPSNPRFYSDFNVAQPRTQVLSNGTYSVMVTSSGSGYSRSGGKMMNRWREDWTRDHWGQFIYLRDVTTGAAWSAGYQPTIVKPDKYEITFSEEKVEIVRRDGDIWTHTQIIVSPEDNVEMRRLTLTNRSEEAREIELTSYLEVVLAAAKDDTAHPAFSNLFVQTEFLAGESALLATRRKRSSHESQVWGFHLIGTEAETVGPVTYETDRARFLGRGRTCANAIVIEEARPLSNTVGSVIDPIFALRTTVKIPPRSSVKVTFATGMAASRDEARSLADKYHDAHLFTREAEIAWTQSQVQLRHLNIAVDRAHLFQRLAGRILFSDPSLRPRSHILSANDKTQSSLWAYGISGDLPILLTRVSEEKDLVMVRELLRAHEYLRLKGLQIDLVILNERPPSYLQEVQEQLLRLVLMSGSQALMDKPGGIFIRRVDLMPPADVILLRTVARVTLSGEKGSLEEQLKRRNPDVELPEKRADAKPETPSPEDEPTPGLLSIASAVARAGAVATGKIADAVSGAAATASANVAASIAGAGNVGAREPLYTIPTLDATAGVDELEFFNGLGGFTPGAHAYQIRLKAGQWTPAPWSNVIANKGDFGFIVTESGSGYTWSENSRENRLTTWTNDPVSDPPSETLYIRDEESGEVWTPTPLPIRGNDTYVIEHHAGYSQFQVRTHGLEHCLQLFVANDANVKFTRLRLKNLGDTTRKLSVTSFVEWVLGFHRTQTTPTVITELDSESGALFARNAYNNEFAGRIAFSDLIDLGQAPGTGVAGAAFGTSFTCDRREFFGRNGSPANPEALERVGLSGRVGGGLDPCAAIQKSFALAPGEEREIILLLGQERDAPAARELLRRFRPAKAIESAFAETRAYWNDLLGTVTVKTPDRALDTMVNRWLLYQTLVCRVWARSAFYQSGGAFGFRDQLQDVMALVYARPSIARAQILQAAARQFREGDVQHWWHPPTGRGVRTHFSDDLLWLPYVTSFYIRATGDSGILDEVVPFLEAEELKPGQEDSYLQPAVSAETGTIREHCARSIDRSLRVGVHGLPLMGSGDWNDGMNRVGHEGRGESVWVAWFLHSTITQFLPHVASAGESFNERLAKYRAHLGHLNEAVEREAWDGEWYRRAFFDDGTPLGSAANDECRIDAIAQSWSIISGAGDSERSRRAMRSVDEQLVMRPDGLIKLFTPPFDVATHDPGYIKGYLPGVRENGGQYTHAAVWTAMAYALLGDGDKAHELYSMLNPIAHGSTRAEVQRYKIEPYVMAGDIYGMEPHTGRGGWSWYTGSSSWMYRCALETILGVTLESDRLRVNPVLPKSWPGFELNYRKGQSTYRVVVSRGETASVTCDDQNLGDGAVPLIDDGKDHSVRVVIL